MCDYLPITISLIFLVSNVPSDTKESDLLSAFSVGQVKFLGIIS